MAKKTEVEGYSVIVFVPVGAFSNGRRYNLSQTEAHEMAQHIKKKIDGTIAAAWSNIDIEPQIAATCDHCGAPWTEKSTTYNGNCCDADEEAEQQRKQGVST